LKDYQPHIFFNGILKLTKDVKAMVGDIDPTRKAVEKLNSQVPLEGNSGKRSHCALLYQIQIRAHKKSDVPIAFSYDHA
jgi:hypothetical protein